MKSGLISTDIYIQIRNFKGLRSRIPKVSYNYVMYVKLKNSRNKVLIFKENYSNYTALRLKQISSVLAWQIVTFSVSSFTGENNEIQDVAFAHLKKINLNFISNHSPPKTFYYNAILL